MKMVVTGISKEAAKDLIERLYGACMWGIEDRGITCYPTGEIEVVLMSESREDQFSGDTDCAGRIAGRHSFTGNGGNDV